MTACAGVLVAALLGQAQALPPGHPPVEAAPLPPDHPPLAAGRPAPTAAELIEELQKRAAAGEPPTFETAIALGRLHYSQARYAESARAFAEAMAHLAPLDARVPAPVAAPAEGCPQPPSPMAERIAQARRTAGCAQALLLEVQDLRALQANALYLAGDLKGARAVLDRLLVLQPRRAQALLHRALLTIEQGEDDVPALRRAAADLEQAAQDPALTAAAQRYRARVDAAIAAGGFTRVKAPTPAGPVRGAPSLPPALSAETIRAFESVERTPQLDARLSALVDQGEARLAARDYEGAMAAYRQVMPLQPENPRLRAGMAWALIGLDRQPMADRVWKVALEDPGAVERLGDALLQKGDAAGARGLWERLAKDRSDWAARLEAKLASVRQ